MGRKFEPGQSGNPKGRPPGSRNKATLAAEALLEGEAEALTRLAIDRAKGGDMTALRLCMERIYPPRKDRPITLKMPPLEKPADATKAMAAILSALGNAEITPSEAQSLASMVEIFRKSLETEDLMRRIEAIEAARAGR